MIAVWGASDDHLPHFQVATWSQLGDLSGDGTLNSFDLLELQAELIQGTDQLRFDLNGDRQVDAHDVDCWISDISGTLPGDANLDRVVDGQDFIDWNNFKFAAANWLGGDFNSDGLADGQDFVVWNTHKFQATDAVPEPCLLGWGTCALLCAVGRHRCGCGGMRAAELHRA